MGNPEAVLQVGWLSREVITPVSWLRLCIYMNYLA